MKPIIFNTEMINAIMSGNKTQTRRIIKPQPIPFNDSAACHNDVMMYESWPHKMKCYANDGRVRAYKIEKYKIGQNLWVRETWNDTFGDNVLYKADGGSSIEVGYSKEPKWRPSICMPRKYARIFLEVINVRVERVQNITIGEAIREGTPTYFDRGNSDPVDAFSILWDSINKKRGYGWDTNPWVWVVEFRSIK